MKCSIKTLAVRGLGLIAIAVVLIAGAYNLRSAVLAHLGLITRSPAVEFEIRLPSAVMKGDLKRDAQVELLTDLNQTLAQLDGNLRAMENRRAVLRGHVLLKFRTSERTVVLSLPGQAQRAFKLRLPPNPSPSTDFSPWHMVDRVATAARPDTMHGMPDDSFAIRYRVL